VQKIEVDGSDASEDFRQVPGNCTITEVKLCIWSELRSEGKASKDVCVFEWQAKFDAEGMTDLWGEKELVEMGDYDCGRDERCLTATGTTWFYFFDDEDFFQLGKNYTCWRSTSPEGKDGTSGMYRCENDPCYKLRDPHLDFTSRQLGSKELLIAGGSCFGVGSFVFGLGMFCCCVVFKDDDKEEDKKKAGPVG